MDDEKIIEYFNKRYFNPPGHGLHQLCPAESEFWICLNFMYDNHPEWRVGEVNDIMKYIMKKFQGRANPNTIRDWINHIQYN